MKKLLTILALFSFVDAAYAVTAVQRYVNTTCSNNGDGTSATCGATNGTGAYRTLGEGYADIITDYSDFVSSDVAVTVDCSGSTADSYGSGANQIVDYNVNVDATRFLTIQAAASDRATALWDTSKYRISGGYYNGIFKIRKPFIAIKNIQMENTKTSAGAGTYGYGIWIAAPGTAGRIELSGNLIRYAGDYTNQYVNAVKDDVSETSGVNRIYINNVFLNWKYGPEMKSQTGGTVHAYNNTCYSNVASGGCFTFRSVTGSTTIAKNNLSNGSVVGYFLDVAAGTWTHNNNLSEDATSPDTSYRSKAVTFQNEGGGDLHLGSGDANAKDVGADLSAVAEGFTTDIDGQTRSGTWDIGADEYQASGSAVAALISMGQLGY